MDFDCGWKSFDGNLSPIFENSFSHAPSPFPEPFYNIRSGPNSLVNLPCCNSPGCSTISNFSSDSYSGNNMDQNSRYLYEPHYKRYMRRNYIRHDTRYFYPNSVSTGSLTNEKQFDSHVNNYQNLRMPLNNMYRGKYDDQNTFKSNSRRKRQKLSKNSSILPKENYITQNIDNNPQTSYDPHILFNSFSNKEVVTNVKQKSDTNYPMTNQPNYSVGSNYSPTGFNQISTDNANFSMEHSSGTEEINFLTNPVEHVTDNSESQNGTILNSFRNEHESTCTDLNFGDAGISKNVNQFDSKDIADMSNCQVTHITMPENSIFNVQDIQQENSENTNLENYFFQPIFEGKDENGEDIVVLVSNSSTPFVDMVNTTETSTNNQGLETTDNQPHLNTLVENTTVSSGTSLEPQVQEVNNEIGANIFSSYVDNYGAEETVVTSKKKYLRSKKTNNKVNESLNENHVVLDNQNEGKHDSVKDFHSQQSTSREDGRASANTNQDINPSNVKCNCRCQQSRRQWIPKWKRRLLWKNNDPMINMQKAYFRKFMNIVKLENEHAMVNEDFWKMYRIIVTQIGGNVLKTLYNILPAMIRNLEASEQRTHTSDLKQNKTPLHVKFAPMKRKQNNSRN